MKNELLERNFDPSLHIVPLDKHGHIPLMCLGEDKGNENIGTFVAITSNGRISAFPAKWDIVLIGDEHKGYISSLELAIENRINERFPKGKDSDGRKIKQYVLACVMYGDEKEEKLIFEITGFQDRIKELESLYKTLHSLRGTTIGSELWRGVENELSSEPLRSWINNLITSLKGQGWAEYVRERLDEE